MQTGGLPLSENIDDRRREQATLLLRLRGMLEDNGVPSDIDMLKRMLAKPVSTPFQLKFEAPNQVPGSVRGLLSDELGLEDIGSRKKAQQVTPFDYLGTAVPWTAQPTWWNNR